MTDGRKIIYIFLQVQVGAIQIITNLKRIISIFIERSFKMYLDDNHFKTVNMDNIADTIVDIIVSEAENNTTVSNVSANNEEITW